MPGGSRRLKVLFSDNSRLIYGYILASRKLDFEKLIQLNLIVAKGIGRGAYYVLFQMLVKRT